MDANKVKLGIAPIGWTNDDMPDLGAEITFEQCVSEMALAGYVGTEIGNKYPKDIEELLQKLKLRNLSIANSWFSTFLLTESMTDVENKFREKCASLQQLGAHIIGCSEQSYSIQGQKKDVFKEKYVMNDAEWQRFASGLSRLGCIAKEYDITLTYHHHMGTVVQTELEIDKMMTLCDPDSVYLLYDSGHLAYAGQDYISVLQKYAKRIKHVHLKDIRPDVIAEVKAKGKSFLEGVRMGTFSVPGDGVIDFSTIFAILDATDYRGYMLVEAEQDPAIANPLEYALKARNYIKKTAKI